MNCFAGESSQTRRINRQSKCQGTFLNLWANAHLWWLQAPLWKILSKNTKERSALHHLWSSESSLCVWAVGGGMYWGRMYWGGNNDLKRWPPVLRIYHKGNLHLLKRHLDRVTYLGVNLRSLERAAHFPTDAAILKNQPMAQGKWENTTGDFKHGIQSSFLWSLNSRFKYTQTFFFLWSRKRIK